MKIKISQLDDLIRKIDTNFGGNLHSQECIDYIGNFEFPNIVGAFDEELALKLQ